MTQHPINPDARHLEEAFFSDQNKKLLDKMRQAKELEERRAALRAVVPNADEEFLDHLLALGIEAETALALVLIPLVAVAWADGHLDSREREAISRAAEERGVEPGTPAHTLLETWLKSQIDPNLLDTWKRHARPLWATLDEADRAVMQERMVGMARDVAEASGGFLGIGSKVSDEERAVLDDIERTLTDDV